MVDKKVPQVNSIIDSVVSPKTEDTLPVFASPFRPCVSTWHMHISSI